MSILQCCYINILETGSVSLTAGTADPNYPLARLYDRDPGKVFQTTAAVTTQINCTQSGSQPVDSVLIPPGHNLSGMSLQALYYNGTSWVAVATWTQPDNNIIVKSWAPVTASQWMLIISSPSIIPQIGELFFSSTYTWERNPQRPSGEYDDIFNVESKTTASGRDRFLVHGALKRQRKYSQTMASATQKSSIQAFWDAWGGNKPFFLCDHEGNWIYGKMTKAMNFKEVSAGRYSFDFEFLEVIP
jgi:hypothetical protein